MRIGESGPGETARSELVRFLEGQPTAVARLLAQHVDDGRGHCQACSVGGQAGTLVWPCTLYAAPLVAARGSGGPHRRP
jgi:hypothetical protein